MMNQMLSLSTGSEFLRPRHVVFFVVQFLASLQFFGDPAKVTPRVTGVTFSLYASVMCGVSSLHLRTLPQNP